MDDRHIFTSDTLLTALGAEQITAAQITAAVKAYAGFVTRFCGLRPGGFLSDKAFHLPNVRKS